MRLTRRLFVLASLAALPVGAQDRGQVTGLPLPRFVSLKAGSANVRRGPGLAHRIDWRFLHRGMPLRVVAEYENWRQVRDHEGMGGWVHFALLSGVRTVLVRGETVELKSDPAADAPVAAIAQGGAIARLDRCEAGWCRIEASGHGGWAPHAALWGTDSDLRA